MGARLLAKAFLPFTFTTIVRMIASVNPLLKKFFQSGWTMMDRYRGDYFPTCPRQIEVIGLPLEIVINTYLFVNPSRLK